jgi:hypothetical protein
VITTWTFLLVPFLSLMFQLQPVKFSRDFATAATVYLALNMLVRVWRGWQGLQQPPTSLPASLLLCWSIELNSFRQQQA